jgi:predicted Fe-S protein YdhL (DUF1289 family)
MREDKDQPLHDLGDEVWRRNEVDSPCIKLCSIHPTERLCIGCLRTIEEITAWGRMAADVRRTIIAELPARAPRIAQRRGGRQARLAGRKTDD